MKLYHIKLEFETKHLPRMCRAWQMRCNICLDYHRNYILPSYFKYGNGLVFHDIEGKNLYAYNANEKQIL